MKILASLIPKGRGGCVLVTSRNRAANGQLASLGEELYVMDKENAKSFLFKCSQILDEAEEADLLVETLGCLPLAIEQAGGFIRETGISIAEYRELYKSNMTEALKEGLSPAHKQLYYHETIATTWEVSFRAVKEKDSLADTILRISAFLDGKLIQKDLFYGVNLMVRGSEVHASEWEVNKAFRTLMSYSLIHALKERRSVEMHLLVQSVIRDVERSEQLQWFKVSAELVHRRFPWGGDLDNMKDCINYLSQAQNSVMHAQELQVTSSTITNLLHSMAGYFEATGQHGEAVAYYQRALTIKEKAFGADHINTASTINNLGLTYDSQGKYDEAIAQYERALRIYEKAFGADHINTADTINNLGSTYHSQGKYDEAIAQYERALRIKEKAFGADHINTASTINNLGLTYDSQGKYDEAIAQYERALRIYEKAFGADHINTASTIMNIGLLHKSRGQAQLAELWLLRGYQIFRTNLGELHPHTLKAATIIRESGWNEDKTRT